MNILNKRPVQIGSIWNSIEFQEFEVIDLKTIDNKEWVFYKNKKTEKEYSCYQEAFLNRFYEKINYG